MPTPKPDHNVAAARGTTKRGTGAAPRIPLPSATENGPFDGDETAALSRELLWEALDRVETQLTSLQREVVTIRRLLALHDLHEGMHAETGAEKTAAPAP